MWPLGLGFLNIMCVQGSTREKLQILRKSKLFVLSKAKNYTEAFGQILSYILKVKYGAKKCAKRSLKSTTHFKSSRKSIHWSNESKKLNDLKVSFLPEMICVRLLDETASRDNAKSGFF